MTDDPSITAYIGLGANLGDRAANLRAAVDALGATDGITVVRVSQHYETDAVGGPVDSPPFLNAAVEIQTTLAPFDLLERLLEIERSLGRVRRDKWEPRPIDLDILLYSDQIIATDTLIVPHPLMHERVFVLRPLAEIAPEVTHPVLRRSIESLLDRSLAQSI